MSEIVFLHDALMARDAFDALPALVLDGTSIPTMVKHMGGKLCRVLIEREGRPEWHAAAWLYINGSERVTAARVKFGRYQHED
jgi:hypothetical protein